MKLKNIGLNALLDFFYFFGSCIVVMLVESLLSFLVDKFVALPYPILTIMRAVIYTLGVPALIGFLGYREGYREAACSTGEVLAGGILASLVPHLLFAMLFHFQSFVSGGVRHLAGLILHGWDVTADGVLPVRSAYPLFLLLFAVYGLTYTGVLTVCKYCGAKKRLADRAELRRGEGSDAP